MTAFDATSSIPDSSYPSDSSDSYDPSLEHGANSAWSRLLAGNRRFARGKAEHLWQDPETRESLLDAQQPIAALLSCSDSRVPPEIIFDAGLGELFTIRTAGQVLDQAAIASLEFAITELHVPLLVVMGHQHCGAVASAQTAVQQILGSCADPDEEMDVLLEQSDDIITRQVGLAVWQAQQADLTETDDIEQINIARTIEYLVTHSEVIQRALAKETLMIVGARYVMETGLVEVLSF